jgi:acetyl esterase
MRTVLWSYLGTRDPRDARVRQIAVTPHVTAAYPPVLIPVGNADPLAPKSVAFAVALRGRGVEVDALFLVPRLPSTARHEYQLVLPTDPRRLALDPFSRVPNGSREVTAVRAHGCNSSRTQAR